MRVNNKRQADNEPRPSRASKRQAAMPTDRITRSAKRLKESNGNAVQLLPGLPMTPRRRKKPATPAPAQQNCTPVEVLTRADRQVEMTDLPETSCVPVSSPPVEQTPLTNPSVVYATGINPDGREVYIPIGLGSDRSSQRYLKVVTMPVTTNEDITAGPPGLDAANPGGPAPVADMGGEFPVTIVYVINVPPKEDAQGSSSQQRCRAPSHSSLISPLSEPAQVCSIPTASRADAPRPPWAPMPAEKGRSRPPRPLKYDWTMLNQEWLKRGDSIWTTPRKEPKPAVVDATYSVNSLKEAAELLAIEMDALCFGQDESPVVEVFVPASPKDMPREDACYSQIINDTNFTTVVYGARPPSISSNMEWTASDRINEWLDVSFDAAMSRMTRPTEHTQTFGPSSIPNPFFPPKTPSNRGSSLGCKIGRLLHHPTTTVGTSKNIFPKPTGDGLSAPKPQQIDAQRSANLQREKELRERLIKLRRARNLASPPRMRNILVRQADGSMSMITSQDTLVPNWGTEEDQYSVEEYEEDNVCY